MPRGSKKVRVVTFHPITWLDCLAMAGFQTDIQHPIETLVDTPSDPGLNSQTFLDNHQRYNGVTMYYGNSQQMMPTKTVLPCHECRLSFEGMPLGCPIDYKRVSTTDQGTLMDTFLVEGNFCSLACVKAYALRQYVVTRLPIYKKALTLIHCMAQQIHGPDYTVPLAIPYTCQQKWGGFMTEDEYRHHTKKWSVFHHVNRKIHQVPTGVYAQTLQ